MAKLPHLPLQRLDRTEDRRKLPAPVAPPVRGSAKGHAAVITGKIDAVAAEQNALPKIEGIDPELILKVNLAAPVQEDTWRTAGFKILSQEPGGIFVLFTDDTELKLFRDRLSEYQKGTQPDQKNPAYNGLFAAIDDVGQHRSRGSHRPAPTRRWEICHHGFRWPRRLHRRSRIVGRTHPIGPPSASAESCRAHRGGGRRSPFALRWHRRPDCIARPFTRINLARCACTYGCVAYRLAAYSGLRGARPTGCDVGRDPRRASAVGSADNRHY